MKKMNDKGSIHIAIGAVGMMVLLTVVFIVLWFVAKPLAEGILAALTALINVVKQVI